MKNKILFAILALVLLAVVVGDSFAANKLIIKNEENGTDTSALHPSDNVHNYVLVADVAETVSVPANTKFAFFASNGDFYANFNGVTAIEPVADITDGDGHVFRPAVRAMTQLRVPITSFSIVCPANCIISIEWYN